MAAWDNTTLKINGTHARLFYRNRNDPLKAAGHMNSFCRLVMVPWLLNILRFKACMPWSVWWFCPNESVLTVCRSTIYCTCCSSAWHSQLSSVEQLNTKYTRSVYANETYWPDMKFFKMGYTIIYKICIWPNFLWLWRMAWFFFVI